MRLPNYIRVHLFVTDGSVGDLFLSIFSPNPFEVECSKRMCGGDEGIRTLDLGNASAALSQSELRPRVNSVS